MEPIETPSAELKENEPEHKPESATDLAQRWNAAVEQSLKLYDDFEKRGDRITKRYRQAQDRDTPAVAGSKFNLFWSNIQTLAPATYARRPKVEVYRRFADSDPVARLSGLILERALQYEIDCGLIFHETMKSVVLDRLLPGRGTAWIRYEPAFKMEEQEVPDPVNPLALIKQPVELLEDEKTPIDYVYWKDFTCSPARVWEDVRWVGRRVMFSKEMLRKRFEKTCADLGGNVADVPCDYDPTQQDKTARDQNKGYVETEQSLKRALIWELWDKESKQLIWVCKGYDLPLDVVDDPAHLEEFFPCPKPLFATMTNDQLVPVADFVIYKDQLQELDTVTNRISLLVQGLRVIGVYDSSQSSLQTLLASGVENRMVPVDSWAAFAEKGGLKGVTDFLPLEQIVKVLEGLYEARERTKQIIFELTGMADIIRGASAASETLGAQQIKAKFANLRLSSRQQQMAEFVTRCLQIKAELMVGNYSPATLIRISSAEQLEEVKANPQSLQAALQFLKSGKVTQYRIEVMADSMIELDEVDQQKRRNEFMSTLANFFLAMKNIAELAPEMMAVSLEMLKFVIRGFPVGRTLEYAIEDATTKIRQRMAQPQQKGPSPEEIKLMIVKLQEAGENQRLRFKEDAATDREELKASVALELAGIGERVDALALQFQQLDAVMDRDHQTDQANRAQAGAQATQTQDHAYQADQAERNRQAATLQAAQTAQQPQGSQQ